MEIESNIPKLWIKVNVGVLPVVTLEAMKMENSITSDYNGVVKQILVAVGDAVPANAVMVEVE